MNSSGRYRFLKQHRLSKQAEFDRVYENNHFAADQTLVIKGIDNGTQETRLGLSIGRQVGNAVVRNRWKRVIREAFRLQRDRLPPGLDLVVRPRKGAECDFQSISQSLIGLVSRLHRQIKRSETGN